MRILLTAYPLHGHVNPMLPLARAARDAGHEVVVRHRRRHGRHLAGHGLERWAAGPTHAETAAADPAVRPLVRHLRGGRAPPSWCRGPSAWRPDLVVADEFDLAGPGRRPDPRASRT